MESKPRTLENGYTHVLRNIASRGIVECKAPLYRKMTHAIPRSAALSPVPGSYNRIATVIKLRITEYNVVNVVDEKNAFALSLVGPGRTGGCLNGSSSAHLSI
jgi:hypothetical protein